MQTKNKAQTKLKASVIFQDERYPNLYITWPAGSRRIELAEKPTLGQPALIINTFAIRGRGSVDWKRAQLEAEKVFESLPFQFEESVELDTWED